MIDTGEYPQPIFKRLDARHAGEMSALEKLCFSVPWSQAQCKGAFSQANFSAWGFLNGRRLMAYVSVYHVLSEMEIINLAVHPAWRRQGLGGCLLRLLLQGAAKMGIEKTILEVREGNFAARSLYEKCGFRVYGRRKHYYPDNGEDALLYGRRISGSVS